MAQQKEKQKKLITEIMEVDAKDGLYKQQTAVEYLIEQLCRIGFTTNNTVEYENEILIAKAMEKEQITDAYTMGSYDMAEKVFNPEQYYEETYNK